MRPLKTPEIHLSIYTQKEKKWNWLKVIGGFFIRTTELFGAEKLHARINANRAGAWTRKRMHEWLQPPLGDNIPVMWPQKIVERAWK